jgi:hypothetical protein
MLRTLALVLLALTGPALAAAEPTPSRATVRPARTPSESPLVFFRRHTLSDFDGQRVAALVKQLDSATYKERERSSAALLAEGPRVLPLLRESLAGATLEKRMRLEKCIKALDDPTRFAAVQAALERLKDQRPEGACPVLLAYLPYVHEDAVDELLDVLCRLATRCGPDPALITALADPHPARRAAAAVVVAAAGSAPQRAAVRRLLEDPDAWVRFRAAQGLLAARDKSAVPVLVALLKAERPVAERAESLLLAVAGKDSPRQSLDDPAKCHAAWAGWWEAARERLDLEAAEVSLALVDGVQLARRIATDASSALITDDLPLLTRSCDVPFNLSCQQTFETREAFDNFYASILKSNRTSIGQDFKIRIIRVVTPADHLRYCTDDKHRAYVNGLPRGGALVVHCAMTYSLAGGGAGGGGTVWHYSVVVRLNGSRARAIAFLELRAEQ